MPAGCEDTFEPDICCLLSENNTGGTLFPAVPGEDEWPDAVRGFLYLICMLWCFLGVAIVADLFMGGIEQICTATYVKTDKTGKQRVFKTWNPVVANLSLMALGSSAPEILLNVMEILFNDFQAGKLGPSTIVGSAAFNLLVIIAVCVVAISAKDGDTGLRKIEGMRVYSVTASFSVFAYLWLYLILAQWTPDIVTIEEAVITFMLFPVVLVLAYLADKNFFRPEPEGGANSYAAKEERRQEVAMAKMKSLKAAGMNDDKAAHIVQDLLKPTTPATYSREAMGLLTGKKKRAMIGPNGKAVNTGTTMANLKKILPSAAKVAPTNEVESLAEGSVKSVCKVKFQVETYSVPEKAGSVTLYVIREGVFDGEASVNWKTENQSAMCGKDYKEAAGTITFGCNDKEPKPITIEIIDDEAVESDETFRVKLIGDSCQGCEVPKVGGGIAQVTIKSDDVADARAEFFAKLVNRDKMDAILAEWKEQFSDAIRPGTNESGEPSKLAYVMHFLTVFWKVAFATVPPPALWGGWGAFCVALGYIAVMTIIVGDICALFGCIIGLKAEVTAITFVALGTSMPDLFASKAAAVSEPDADNSIGNVTGSNCVNVFLGLGLPWLIAAAYWTAAGPSDDWYKAYITGPSVSATLKESLKEYAPGGSKYGEAVFVVAAGNLGLSVVVFICCSITCLATLAVRRKLYGGELGGPNGPKYATAALFVLLWGLYVIISSLATEGMIDGQI